MIRSIVTTTLSMIVAMALCLASVGLVLAETTTTTESVNPSCPDAKVFSNKLFSAIDWDNIFPIRIAGGKLGSGDIPDGAADSRFVCMCLDNNGVPFFGTQLGMWRPNRLIEVVRVANCSPALGGTMLQSRTRLIGGPEAQEHDSTDVHFYNVNVWAFPLITMLNLFTSTQCGNDGFMDVDLINISTVDPTWNDEELSLLFTPEAYIFCTPPALALQLADAAASTVGKPMNSAIGSAGTWGSLYPLSGFGLTMGSAPQVTSLIATKALAKLHRIAFARRTMGNDTMCGAKISVTITKTQYRYSTFYPVPEVSGKLSDMYSNFEGEDKDLAGHQDSNFEGEDKDLAGHHVIGEPTFLWGEWRNRPGTGEDYLYVVWNWTDCCVTNEAP